MSAGRRIAVGVTGASGAIYAARTIAALLEQGCHLELVFSDYGKRLLLDELGLHPLLDLNMRLGEGSGAAVAVLVLRAALACHSGMATFAEAHVSNKDA